MGGGDYGDNCFNHRTDAENVNKDDVQRRRTGGRADGMAVSSFVRLFRADFGGDINVCFYVPAESRGGGERFPLNGPL